MTDNKIINTTIEILGKYYPVRCQEFEVKSLQQAAAFLNEKMQEVQESGKVINLERIAIITALNVANEYLQMTQQKTGLVEKINQRIAQLQNKIESAISHAKKTELIYSSD